MSHEGSSSGTGADWTRGRLVTSRKAITRQLLIARCIWEIVFILARAVEDTSRARTSTSGRPSARDSTEQKPVGTGHRRKQKDAEEGQGDRYTRQAERQPRRGRHEALSDLGHV